MIMSKNKNALLSLVITSACYSGNSLAAEACTGSTDTCGHTTGFYIGGEFGTSNTNFDKALAKSLASVVGLDISSAKVEDDDHSAGIYLVTSLMISLLLRGVTGTWGNTTLI